MSIGRFYYGTEKSVEQFKSNLALNKLQFELEDSNLIIRNDEQGREIVSVEMIEADVYELCLWFYPRSALFLQIESLLLFSGCLHSNRKPWLDFLASANSEINLEKLPSIIPHCESGIVSCAFNLLGEKRYIRPVRLPDEGHILKPFKKTKGIDMNTELECQRHEIQLYRYVR